MNSGEVSLSEAPPVPLALARLQARRGFRTHRPSLQLASLKEVVDESPRRYSDEPHSAGTDDEDAFSDLEIIQTPPNPDRRASDATFCERYRQLSDVDEPPPELHRRTSLALPSDVISNGDKSRRRSWAARLQLERKKRRKSGDADSDIDSDKPVYVRQKRPSWWNVFVPDNVLKNRSRRASQQLSRSVDSIEHTFKRSKSRSVDHGLGGVPGDFDALRSKVESRFDAVTREEDEQSKRAPPPPPIKTKTYKVGDRDTLTSVAARFDTTPSELTKLNRLATQFIFPGQALLVPDKPKDGEKESDSGDSTSQSTQGAGEPTQEKEILESLRPVSPAAAASSSAPQRFLKINVRHITDGQGVVSGVLLVTPNAIMFDPNVSDTLVMEHGPESYGVIAPMEYVASAAIFHDIAHMRTRNHRLDEKLEQAEIYYMNKPDHSPGKDSLLVKDETFPELQETIGEESGEAGEGGEGAGAAGDEAASRDGDSDGDERGGAAFPKAFDRELVTPTSLQQQTIEERRKSLLDHHWAIPSKDRMSLDQGSEVSSGDQSRSEDRVDSEEGGAGTVEEAGEGGAGRAGADAHHLVKLSYHDSGIDIRDPALNVTPATNKKVYSDADIVLSAEWTPPVCVARGEPPLSAPPLGGPAQPAPRKPAAVSFSLDGTQPKEDTTVKTDKKNKMLKRLSYPLSWVEGLTGEGATPQNSQSDSLPASADSHNSSSVFSKVFNRRSSLGGFGRSQSKSTSSSGSAQPRLDYRSMVSVDDMPDLFVSFDKLLPRAARASDEPPLYLRLRMGRCAGRPLPRAAPLMSYGRKRIKPEYWFGVPRNRVDDLYKFLNHWVPERYGPVAKAVARGYELIDSDTEWDDDDVKPLKGERSGSAGDVTNITRESWEVLSMSDELRRALYSSGASIDLEFSPPDLIGNSEIFTMEHREKLCGVLPARAQGYMWSLCFSTSQHGFSLASMYRKMQRVDSPVLLVIQDTDNNVFGALTSCALRPSEHFYGTGESLLFSFRAVEERRESEASIEKPESGDDNQPPATVKTKFKYWGWTGENLYFIRGSNDNISIGAGDGKFGIWLDGDLYLGRTQCCTTYGNEPLTTREDFIVKIMECWTFI